MNTIIMSLARSKAIAMTAILATVLSSFGYFAFTQSTQAANMTSVSDTLSDSDLGVAADHEIVFTTPTGIATDENVSIEFPLEFQVSTSSVAASDIAVSIAGVGAQTVGSTCGANQVAASTTPASGVLNVYFCTATVAAGGTTTIQVGTNAGGSNQFVNPEQSGSYEILLGTSATGGSSTVSDGGATRIVIIDDVVVTAQVPTIFTFVVNGINTGGEVNGTSTDITTTATTIPFGEISSGPANGSTGAQNLQVTTNARNGFTVTVQANQTLLSSTGADIDVFSNGSASTTQAWESPVGYLNDENTYGHWGFTSGDSTLAGGDDFGTDLWSGTFVSGAQEVFYHDGPSDGIADDIGSTTVGYKVEIMSFQEAGDDYTATLTYVATPVF